MKRPAPASWRRRTRSSRTWCGVFPSPPAPPRPSRKRTKRERPSLTKAPPKVGKQRPAVSPPRRRRAVPWLPLAISGIAILVLVGFVLLRQGDSPARVLATLNVPDVHSLVFAPDSADHVYFGNHFG